MNFNICNKKQIRKVKIQCCLNSKKLFLSKRQKRLNDINHDNASLLANNYIQYVCTSSDVLLSLMSSPEKNSLSLWLKKANEEKVSSCLETEQKHNLV